MSRKTMWLACALLFVLLFAVSSVAFAAGTGERLSNGSFEEGFGGNGVGRGWTGFNNGGSAEYIYSDDTGSRFAADGKHSQFLRISTLPYFVTEANRYSGIYQTVAVVPGQPYTFSMRGMLRTTNDDPDLGNWPYALQWAMDPNGGTDWGRVTWYDIPLPAVFREDDTGVMSPFTTTFNTSSNKLTLFIRMLKKWPTYNRVAFGNVDAVSLVGAVPASDTKAAGTVTWPDFVYTTKPFIVHVSASDPVGVSQIKLFDDSKFVTGDIRAVGALAIDTDLTWIPTTAAVHTLQVEIVNAQGQSTYFSKNITVVPISEFLSNGNFEGGFAPNGVALKWNSFQNNGRHVFEAFYDDNWLPVLAAGQHSQLIEISSIGEGYGDPDQESDRVAGICQVVTGLTPNATYYVNANGLLRITEGDEHTDDWSWVAQWGYMPGADAGCGKWFQVTNWDVMPWSHVDFRESPTTMDAYTRVITAPTNTITVYFAAWKKWAVGAREFLVNYDNLSLAGYKAK